MKNATILLAAVFLIVLIAASLVYFNRTNERPRPREVAVATDELPTPPAKRPSNPWLLDTEAMAVLRDQFPTYGLPFQQDRSIAELRDAIEREDPIAYQLATAETLDVNWNDGGEPIVFTAIRTGQADLVELLITRGVHIIPPLYAPYSGKNRWSQTPLYVAARSGNERIVSLLLQSGCNPNHQNTSAKTPIIGAIESGSLDVFELLLANDAKIPFDKTLYHDQFRLVDKVVECDREIPEAPFPELTPIRFSLSDLLACCPEPRIVKRVEAARPKERRTTESLFAAVQRGNLRELQRLVAAGADLEAKMRQRNLLHAAADAGNPEICVYLLDQGFDPSQPMYDNSQMRPIHLAIRSGSTETVDLLVERGAAFNSISKQEPAFLYLAVGSGQLDMVNKVIDAGAPLDDFKPMGHAIQSFIYASQAQTSDRSTRLAIVKRLIEAGATLKSLYPVGQPERVAASAGHLELFRLIEAAKPIVYDDVLLRAAFGGGNFQLCKRIVEQGAELKVDRDADHALLRRLYHQRADRELLDLAIACGLPDTYPDAFDTSAGYNNDHDYAHPLYHAALCGDYEYCKYLLETFPAEDLWQPIAFDSYEYDSNTEYFLHGNSPLYAAVYNDHWDVLELFLEHGFENESGQRLLEINSANRRGFTVLHEAVRFSASRCVQMLLAAGADPLRQSDSRPYYGGDTALHISTRSGNGSTRNVDAGRPKMFPMLAAVAATRNKDWTAITDALNQTPLHLHARAGNFEICKSLLHFGADPLAKSSRGQTPLASAISGTRRWGDQTDRLDLCIFLAERSLSANGRLKNEDDYYRLAAGSNLFGFCRYLTGQGVTPDLNENVGILCSAAKNGQLQQITRLLERGGNINEQDHDGKTPLHHATEQFDVPLVTMLLERGADPNVSDRYGRTPLFSVFWRDNAYQSFLPRDPESWMQASLNVLDQLLAAGADPDAIDKQGKKVDQQMRPIPEPHAAIIAKARNTN